MSDGKDSQKKDPVVNAVAEELAALQLANEKRKARMLELEEKEREYHIKDLEARIAERSMHELQQKEDREAQGRTFAQQNANDKYHQSICTHKKGGVVSERDMQALRAGGNGEQHAVLKHRMINGDVWVRCLRCGRTWNPPVAKNFFFDTKGRQVAPKDGLFDQAKFQVAQQEYVRAVQFNTNNSMSASVQCRFFTVNENGEEIDAAGKYRESIASTNLR